MGETDVVEAELLHNPPVALWKNLARTFSLMARQVDHVLVRFGLTGPQFGVLRTIQQAGGNLPLSQIGDRLLVTCANITGLVDRLERDGHVVRERRAEDRRVVLACITPQGSEVADRAAAALVEHITRVLEFLPPEEQRALAEKLDSIQQYLTEEAAS